jgi:AcrR family transcriptional regulator
MSKKLPADERRQALLEVAERLFATRPYDQISVQEIAAEAGVARGLIHHYFGGKDDVLAAVMRELTPKSAPPPPDSSLPIDDRIEQRVDMLLAAIEQNQQAWLATLALGPNLPPGPVREAAEKLWAIQYDGWLQSFEDFLTDNDRTKNLFAAYRGLNQATCRLWLDGDLSRDDARRILIAGQTALITQVGPAMQNAPLFSEASG